MKLKAQTNQNLNKKPNIMLSHLFVAVSTLLVSHAVQADTNTPVKKIGDLEIYKPAQGGRATVTMMLDTSGSMLNGSVVEDYPDVIKPDPTIQRGIDYTTCIYVGGGRTAWQTKMINQPLIDKSGNQYGSVRYTIAGCPVSARGAAINVDTNIKAGTAGNITGYLDRMSRLKIAMITMIANGNTLPDDHQVGIGNYSALGFGKAGQILVPAKPLTQEHRQRIVNTVASLNGSGLTPSAHAYAEVGAYMMGTSTSDLTQRKEKRGYVLATMRLDRPWWKPTVCSNTGDSNLLSKSWSKYPKWYACAFYELNRNNVGFSIKYDAQHPTYNLPSPNSNHKLFTSLFPPEVNKLWVPPKDQFGTMDSRANNSAHYGFEKEGYWPYDDNSGMIMSSDDTKKPDLRTYQSPVTEGQCDGYGIYFLTDGFPNNSNYAKANAVMSKSLEQNNAFARDPYQDDCQGTLTYVGTGVNVRGNEPGWKCIGEYAKKLRSADNPSQRSIKTAAVGFGNDFVALNNTSRTIKIKQDGDLVDVTIPDCNATSAVVNGRTVPISPHARNLCKLAEIKDESPQQATGGYGEGGFTATNDPEAIASSFVNFAASLVQVTNASPTGVLTVPKDPYKAIGEIPYAFVPTIQSQLTEQRNKSNIWPGNVKKYNLYDSTLYGKSNKKLFESVAGKLDPTVEDLWSPQSSTVGGSAKNDSVRAGGLYANLKHPDNAVNDVRQVYVEDITAPNASTTTFKKISVGSNGRPVGFDQLFDSSVYTRANQIKLLQFLGFTEATGNRITKSLDEWINDTKVSVSDLVMLKPTNTDKVLGAAIHTKPISISYGATLDAQGRVQDTARNDYVLFGGMDGAIHLVNAKDQANGGGTEEIAIIPRIMIKEQADALVPNSTYSPNQNRPAGSPNFGVDGHWTFKNQYQYDYANRRVQPEGKIMAYGGMRLGGVGLLALDITNKNVPQKAFTNQNSALIDNTTQGFERIGYIWNQPTLARIKVNAQDKNGTDVIIFGGGYDMCYEYENFQVGMSDPSLGNDNKGNSCSAKPQAQGNAVYVVNAKTGQLLWKASNSGANATHNGLKHSVVGGISAIDRNSDGIADHLYFADLGGQAFRVDFDGNITQSSITRILKNEYEGTDKAKYTRRFYETPVFSIHRNDETNALFGLVNIISGDRSSPLSKMRQDNEYADRVYGIIDSDVTSRNLFQQGFSKGINDLTDRQFTNLAVDMGAVPTGGYSNTVKQAAIDKMKSGQYQGWYYPLTRFDGFANVRFTKGVGKADIFAQKLYTSVYNPDMNYSDANSCSATIAGGTERQLYCLPYGICLDEKSHNGTSGFIRAGQGIQELNFGPLASKDGITRRTLINTVSLTDQLKVENRVNAGADPAKRLVQPGVGLVNLDGSNHTSSGNMFGLLTHNFENGAQDAQSHIVGGSSTASSDLTSERYVLQPKQWYEKL